jgi:hypothetical protein
MDHRLVFRATLTRPCNADSRLRSGGYGETSTHDSIGLIVQQDLVIDGRRCGEGSIALLWRTGPFEQPSAKGGCTRKPVVGGAIFWQLG